MCWCAQCPKYCEGRFTFKSTRETCAREMAMNNKNCLAIVDSLFDGTKANGQVSRLSAMLETYFMAMNVNAGCVEKCIEIMTNFTGFP